MGVLLKSDGIYYILEDGYRIENPYTTCAQLAQAEEWVYDQLDIAEEDFGRGFDMSPFIHDAAWEVTVAYMEKAIIHARSRVKVRFDIERDHCKLGYPWISRAFRFDSTFLEDDS